MFLLFRVLRFMVCFFKVCLGFSGFAFRPCVYGSGFGLRIIFLRVSEFGVRLFRVFGFT